MVERWQIELLGRLRARRGGVDRPGSGERVISHFRSRKTGLLLAYLAYYRQRIHPRDELIELFWPEHDPEAGRQSLRTALSWLRQQLGAGIQAESPVIMADRAVVQLDSGVTTDVDEFRAALRAAERAASPAEQLQFLTEGVDRYHGELLPGYYEDWVLGERQWLAESYLRVLVRLVSRHEEAGEFERALDYAQRAVRADLLREEAHRDLIRLYAAVGGSDAALRQYRELERLLQAHLGVAPDTTTTELAQEIERLMRLRPREIQPFGRPGVQHLTPSPDPVLRSSTSEPDTGHQALMPTGGENRLVTLLLVAVSGSHGRTASLPIEEATTRVNRLWTAVADVLLKHGAQIVRFEGDGMQVMFGASQTREDDAERAVRAALEIHQSARRLGLEVTVGINTADVSIGTVGSEKHQEMTVAGPAITVAARLQCLAEPGQILVGEATYRLTRRAFEYSSPSLTVPGLAQPVAAHRLERALPRPDRVWRSEGRRAELIGRVEELAKLQQAIAAVLGGRGQIVSLVGEAGVGKSRIVAELRAAAEVRVSDAQDQPGASPTLGWLEGRCQELAMTTGYSLFIDLFRDYFQWRSEEDGQTRGRRLVECLRQFVARQELSAARVEEMVPLLGHLLSLRFGADGDERLKHASPEQIRHQTFLAIRDFFVALAQQQPVILVCEDLHWADTLSLDLLSLLMESLSRVPLMLLCVYRPEREHRSRHLATIAAQKCPERFGEIHLRELTPEESGRLVASILGDDEPAVGQQILERARGNPLFIEEVAHSLIDAGRLYRHWPGTSPERGAGGWRAREGLTRFEVPESVQSVIRSRVDRLRPDLRHVLQNAAVIGPVFRRRWLEAMIGEGPALERALGELEEQALIYQERAVPEAEYSFRHVLTQETIYLTIERRHRGRFHEQAGETIEAIHSEQLEEWFELLAYHYERSPQDEKAIEYLLKAGEKAQQNYLNAEAIDCFQRALSRLEVVSPDALRQERLHLVSARIHESMGHVLERTGRHEEARAAYHSALAQLPEENRIWQSRLHRRIGNTWVPSAQFQRALEAYAAAETVLGEQPDQPSPEWWQEWIDIQSDRFSAQYRRADVAAMDALLEKLRPVIERDGTPIRRLRLLSLLIQRNLRRDRMRVVDETLTYAREAYALREQLMSDPGEIAASRFRIGLILLQRGELEEAQQHLDAALPQAERTGDMAFLTFCLTHRTNLARKQGRLDEVRQFASRSLEAAAAAGRPEYVAWAQANQAWVAWREGNLVAARANGETALPVMREGSLKLAQWAALWPLLAVALAEDNLPEAINHARALLDPMAEPLPDAVAAAVQEAIQAHEAGEPERAGHCFQRAVERARERGYL